MKSKKYSKQFELTVRKNHYSIYIYLKYYKIMSFEKYCSCFIKHINNEESKRNNS